MLLTICFLVRVVFMVVATLLKPDGLPSISHSPVCSLSIINFTHTFRGKIIIIKIVKTLVDEAGQGRREKERERAESIIRRTKLVAG